MSSDQTPEAAPTVKAATTTKEQNLHTRGQRRINLIWEVTQAGIALSVVVSNIIYAFTLMDRPDISDHAANSATLLANAFFLVIGFYFGRTNHTRVGDDVKEPRNRSR